MSSEAGRFYPFGDNAADSIRSLGMSEALSRNWWLVGLRGVLAIAFGVFTLFMPGITMLSLVAVFAAYMIIDGGFTIGSAVRAAQRHERWLLLLLQGILSIAVAIIAIMWPAITVLAFVLLVAAWAIVSGGLTFFSAFRLKQEHGRIWLALGGLASIILGVLLVLAPIIGAVVLVWWIGIYALIFGGVLLVLAYRLRARQQESAA